MITAYIKNTDTNTIINSYWSENKDAVMNWMMKNLFEDLGNGGMSAQKIADGSIGSLWRCADEIYDCLSYGEHYFYCDREFWIDGLSEEKKDDVEKTYLFGFSAVVDNNVKITAKNYEEAVSKYKESLKKFQDELMTAIVPTSWVYDRNICDEGDEVIKE